jgi:hypothetical protein
MLGEPTTRPMTRVLVVITVILVLILGSVALSYQTWEQTFGKWSASTDAEVVVAHCVALQSTFGDEHPLMLRYLAVPQASTQWATTTSASVEADHFPKVCSQVW